MQLTLHHLQAGTGCSAMRAATWRAPIQRACDHFQINTPTRLAAFLAQIGHESGRLVYVREIWGPTPAQARYEGRLDLGNTQPGDGKRFMGRGLIQTTGRANYAGTTKGLRAALGSAPDFIEAPAMLEVPEWAAMSAAWFWSSRDLNPLADAGAFTQITRRINGGTNGMADRLVLWERAKEAVQ